MKGSEARVGEGHTKWRAGFWPVGRLLHTHNLDVYARRNPLIISKEGQISISGINILRSIRHFVDLVSHVRTTNHVEMMWITTRFTKLCAVKRTRK